MKDENPCVRGCTGRSATCHASCEKYAIWKENKIELERMKREQKKQQEMYKYIRNDAVKRMKRLRRSNLLRSK